LLRRAWIAIAQFCAIVGNATWRPRLASEPTAASTIIRVPSGVRWFPSLSRVQRHRLVLANSTTSSPRPSSAPRLEEAYSHQALPLRPLQPRYCCRRRADCMTSRTAAAEKDSTGDVCAVFSRTRTAPHPYQWIRGGFRSIVAGATLMVVTVRGIRCRSRAISGMLSAHTQ
jgi:hypothetical protein